MNHGATANFWRLFHALPHDVRDRAEKAFALMKADPRHPSLQLKKVGTLWSARVSRNHRALAVEGAEGLVWIWIGAHADYERLIR